MNESVLADLERRIAIQEDKQAISNIMGRYQYLMTGGQNGKIGRELYAWDVPGNHCEYGPLGVYEGQNAIDFFDKVDVNLCNGKKGGTANGTLEYHQITTPVIEIAGDRKTAKAMWMSTGVMITLEEGFYWDNGKYAVDFIRTEKGWKIWHLHVCDLLRMGFDEDPVKNAKPLEPVMTPDRVAECKKTGEGPEGFPVPDGPTTFHYAYCNDHSAPREPLPPEPYETFSDTFSY